MYVISQSFEVVVEDREGDACLQAIFIDVLPLSAAHPCLP